jgi:endonuclease/exonuclease/phosphatase (EEP) superfamily protein YafD
MAEVSGAVDVGEASPPRRQDRKWSRWRTGMLVLGWLIVGGLALTAIMRLVAWDTIEPFIVLDALSLIVYLPAWVVAAVALIARRWWLGGAALVIVAAQVAFAVPELTAATPAPAWARTASSVRVLDAGVDDSMIFHDGYVQAIEQAHPDIITLTEFTPPAYRSMQASGVLNNYPYRCAAPQFGAIGFLIASRLPLSGCQVHSVYSETLGFTPYLVSATLSTPAGPVALRLAHTLAPFPSSYREWQMALAAIDRSVRASTDGRMLMIGDFNATWGNRDFVALLHHGLTDGAAARGKATDMSWPNGAIVPAFVRIDHVLTGTHLAVTDISTKPGFGSDHRYVDATVAIQK